MSGFKSPGIEQNVLLWPRVHRAHDEESMPRVSVIIPVYNAEKHLGDCLGSVSNQTLKDIEVICVDDGSSDRSVAELDRWCRQDGRLTVVRQANGGPGAARNAGIGRATGKYLMFLDADDMLFSVESLSRAVSVAEKTGCDVLCATADRTDVTGCRNDGRMTWMLQRHLLPSADVFCGEDVGENLFFAFSLVPWAKLFRREFVIGNNLLFPHLRRSEDFPFVQLALAVGRISAWDEPLVLHRTGVKDSLESTKDESPLTFMEGERCLQDWLVKRGVSQCVLNSAARRAILRLDYNFRSMRTAEGAETVFSAIRETYPQLMVMADGCGVPEFIAAKGRLDALLRFDSAWSWSEHERRALSVVARELKTANFRLKNEITALKGSEVYHVGLFVTWPARRVYRMLKCYRENGLKYTLRRLILGKGRGRG